MKHLLLRTIAAVVLVGCGESQEAKDRALKDAIKNAMEKYGREDKQAIAEGADVNVTDEDGETPLDWVIEKNHTEIADLLRKHGGKTGAELKAEGK